MPQRRMTQGRRAAAGQVVLPVRAEPPVRAARWVRAVAVPRVARQAAPPAGTRVWAGAQEPQEMAEAVRLAQVADRAERAARLALAGLAVGRPELRSADPPPAAVPMAAGRVAPPEPAQPAGMPVPTYRSRMFEWRIYQHRATGQAERTEGVPIQLARQIRACATAPVWIPR